MKSSKQKRLEIKQHRIQKAKKLAKELADSPLEDLNKLPLGFAKADPSKLAHLPTYASIPQYYSDIAFKCVDCGSEEIWTAKQQKWWYEEAKGHIYSTAIRCRPCRKKGQAMSAESRRLHLEGLAKKKKGS